MLGVHDPKAYPFAIDLGIAMQLTNIARDVAEDAAQGRRYLPASVLGDVEPKQIEHPNPGLQIRLAASVEALLNLAERFYISGQRGLIYLPDRARLGRRLDGPRTGALSAVDPQPKYARTVGCPADVP